MKAFFIILATAALALLGYALFAPGPESTQPKESAATNQQPISKSPPPTSTKTDQLAIFQSAFWRSPAAGDEILGAERREWADADGLDRWQWFIALHPSPELVKYVRDDNAFGLRATASPATIENAPAWFAFKSSELEVLRSTSANLQFIFNKSDNTLYATNSGHGFTRGAPQGTRTSPASPPVTSHGRLPRTPPPQPTPAPARSADGPR